MANSIQFKVPFEGVPEKPIEVMAYAFDRQGTCLGGAALKDGAAELKLSDEQAKGARIFFAPAPRPGVTVKPTLELMEQQKAYEARWTFDPQRAVYELQSIPSVIWKNWFWCACRVLGRVVRPTMIGSVMKDLPVCHARVHVCEVDKIPRFILRLPDDILRRVATELIHEVEHVGPRPGPGPDPGPEFRFDPQLIDPTPEKVAKLGQRAALLETPVRLALAPTPMPLELRAALSSPSATLVRNTLVKNVNLLRPYLCLWPWIWPYFYTSSELAVIETDLQGRFDTTIFYLCAGDHPDLYFWVEYSIGGVLTPVYKPAIPCHTSWDYPCGSETIIRVYDPRVVGVSDPQSVPGKQVAVLTIGNDVSIPEIHASGSGEGLTSDGRPFGGSLEPHVWFGQDLLASGITHYRWSYRKVGGADPWHAMDHLVVRHYAVLGAAGTLTFKAYVLGPDPAIAGSVLHQIQGNAPAGSLGWTPMVDGRSNTASGYLLSHLLVGGNVAAAAGKYELKLELFRASAPLTPVNLSDEGIALKIPTGPAPFGTGDVTTVAADEAHVFRDAAGKIVAFRLVLFIDNQQCSAATYEVTGSGLSAVGECGFLRYVPTAGAHLSFKASHPNNFGNFSFTTVRGTTDVPAARAVANLGTASVNGFTYNPSAGTYAKDVPVSALLSAACPSAALAEQVYVTAWATDGWSILSYLDAYSGMRAYALTPATP